MRTTSRRGGKALALAAMAAIAGVPLAPPIIAAGPVPSAVSQSNERTAPVVIAQQVAELAFLGAAGAPARFVVGGCPWPGRRAACARRGAGAVRRMR